MSGKRLVITYDGRTLFDAAVDEIETVHNHPLPAYYRSQFPPHEPPRPTIELKATLAVKPE